MSLMNLTRFFSLCLAVAAAPALADESGITISGGTVKLDCPAGTVQNTTKISKDTAVFCRKTSKQDGNEPSRHGPYVAFWGNGQKQAAGQTKDGFQVGKWTFWDANGVKTGETEFLRDNFHGTRIEFYANGNKKTEQQWVHGKREGLAVAYSEDGQKVSEAQYEGGRMVKEQRFENGKPVANK
jgi:antitoxin component YwqK of YwqJK toxin-antitoxin module